MDRQWCSAKGACDLYVGGLGPSCKPSTQSKNLCSRFSGRHGSATERLSDGATGPIGICALRAHHTRLIKTGDYQARSFTALEAAM
jgi:hypothetical protein